MKYLILFGNPQNVVFTEYLVSALLNIPYDEVKGKIEFKSNTSSNVKIKKKKIEKDIVFLVDILEGHILNLEMNFNDLTDVKILRNTKYISDIFSNLLKPGESEKSVKYVTQFNFNTEYADKKNKLFFDTYYFQNNKGNILTDKLQIVHINVAEMSKMWYSGKYKRHKEVSKIVFWFASLIMEQEKIKLNELVLNSPIPKNTAEDLERKVLDMSDDSELYGRYYNKEEEDKFWRDLERQEIKEKARTEALAEGLAKGHASGLAEGLAKGLLQKQIEFVLTMYEKQYDLKTISDLTKLDIEDIQKIIKNNKFKSK